MNAPVPWEAFATILAEQPTTFRRLLAVHKPAAVDALCMGCTTPGTGTPSAAWPCLVYELAARAAQIHTARRRPPKEGPNDVLER
jgi:hypothetical protein